LTSPEDEAEPAERPAVPADGSTPADDSPARPGAGTFTIDGRAAPALFVVGWLATVLGLGILAIGVSSGPGGPAIVLSLVGLVLTSVGLVAGAGSQGIERRARARAAYRGPSPVLVFAASVPISLMAIVMLTVPISLVGLAVDGPVGRFASVAAQAVIYIGLVRLLVVDAGALSWGEMGLRRPDAAAIRELGRGAAWALPVIAATLPLAVLLRFLLPVMPQSLLPPTGETAGFLIQLVAGAVIAPVGEEILFRGLATTAWVRSHGVRRGLIRGALFFAVVHVLTISGSSASEAASLALVGFATRIPVALALGWLFVRSRSIWVPIGLHATFNAILLTLGEVALRQVG